MCDFGMITKSKEMCWLRNDLVRTTTHLVVKVTGHRRRLRVVQMLCPRSADVKERTTSQDHRERIIHLRSNQLSPALQSELKKLQQVRTRGSGV